METPFEKKHYPVIVLTMLVGLVLPLLCGGLLYKLQNDIHNFSNFIYGILHQAGFFLDFYQIGIAILIGLFILSINRHWTNISRGLIVAILIHVAYALYMMMANITI